MNRCLFKLLSVFMISLVTAALLTGAIPPVPERASADVGDTLDSGNITVDSGNATLDTGNFSLSLPSDLATLDFSQIPLPDKGNPKLDSQLNQMVESQNTQNVQLFTPGPAEDTSANNATDNTSLLNPSDNSTTDESDNSTIDQSDNSTPSQSDNTSPPDQSEDTTSVSPSAAVDKSTGDKQVEVVIECVPGQVDAVAQAAADFGTIETSSDDMVQMTVPVSSLTDLSQLPGVSIVREPFRPVEFTVSEGKSLINADAWNNAGYNGSGVKIGILDGSFGNYATMQSAGEVPSPAGYYWSPSIGHGTDIHGTACTEIVYDIAPNATYYLANVATDAEWGAAVDWLIAQGVNVISCSIGFTAADPAVESKVAQAQAAGVTWCQAAGNYAQHHWGGTFSGDAYGNNIFYGSNTLNAFPCSAGMPISITLRWNDTWGSSSNDYDLYLCFDVNHDGTVPDASNEIVAASEDVQDGAGCDPVEQINYTAGYSGYYYIVIHKYSGANVVLHLFADFGYSDPIEYPVASGSLCIPADSPNVVTVGAVAYNTPTIIESFSSQGPTDSGLTKPDIVAGDNVTSATYGGRFLGTSAATPLTAGAAALVKQRYPTDTPAQIQSYLEGNAIDLGSAGKDNVYGSGRLYLGNPITYTLTMAVSGNGTTSPSIGTHQYAAGTNVTITATTISGSRFLNWSGDTGTIINVNSSTTNITMNGNYDIVANFSNDLALTMAVSGNGTVTPSVGNHAYPPGTTVNITATPAPNWAFSNWTETNPPSFSEILRPNGAGSITSIDSCYPDDNINWDKVDDIIPDDDSTYIQNTHGTIDQTEQDLYSIQNHSIGSGIINDVMITLRIKGSCSSAVVVLIKTHGTIEARNFGSGFATWGYMSRSLPTNPFTNLSWTWDEIDDLEVGLQVYYLPLDLVSCTQIYVTVDYTLPNTISNVNSANTSLIMNTDKTVTANFTRTQGVLTMSVSGNGTITPGTGTYPVGTLQITATPDPGWTFVNWTGDVGTITNVNSATTNITISGDYAITANFACPVLTMAVSGNGTVTPSVGPHQVLTGSNVTITATPATNWAFNSWTESPLVGSSTEILRPDGPGSETSIDSQYPSSGAHWDKLDETTPDEDSTYVENLNGSPGVLQRDLYSIQNHSTGTGTISKIRITARCKFNAPYPCLSLSLKTHGTVYDYNQLCGSVWSDISQEFTANPFTGVAWTWSEIDELEAGLELGGSTYAPDWSRCTQLYVTVYYSISPDIADINAASTNITLNSDKTVTANFVRTAGVLIMSVNGSGAVTPGTGTYPVGSMQITATPDPGWRFVNWSGDVNTITNINSSTTNITINGDYNIVANFSRSTLTIAVIGNGTVTPAVGSYVYDVDTIVSINATPAAGWTFVNWTGNVTNPSSTNTTVIMDTDKTVTAVFKMLTSIQITPDNPTIAKGRTQQFTLTGIFSDSSTCNITTGITWASINTTVATINAGGLASSNQMGQTTITALYGSLSDTTLLTVGPHVLDSITITPGNPSVWIGYTCQLSATGTYSDASTENITCSVVWSSNNTAVARVNQAGLTTGYATDTANITASKSGVTGSVIFTVGGVRLDSILLTPDDDIINLDASQITTVQYTASAEYSNGTSSDVTNSANWTSSVPAVATVNTQGLVTILTAGSTNISANYYDGTNNATATALLTVLADTTPPGITINSPVDGQILADTSVNVTGSVDSSAAGANLTLEAVDGNSAYYGGPWAISGNYSITITLKPGTNILRACAVDAAGNYGYSNTVIVTVNAIKPGVTITSPLSGNITRNTNITVSGNISGNVTAASLILNGVFRTIDVTGGSFSANVSLVEGKNIIVVNAYAGGHNGESAYLGTSGVIIVTKDTTAPVITIEKPMYGQVTHMPQCDLIGTVSDNLFTINTVSVSINGGGAQTVPVSQVGLCQRGFSCSLSLPGSVNTITVTAVDGLGNISTVSVMVYYDSSRTEITIGCVNGTTVTSSNFTVDGYVHDTSITTANLTLNGATQQISVAPLNPGDEWAHYSQNVSLIPGTNTIEVKAGNGTSGNVTIIRDNTPPDISINLGEPRESIEISVISNEPLSGAPLVTVNTTATLVPVTMTGILTNWTGTYGSVASPIANGFYIITVIATDKAGNITTKTAHFSKNTIDVPSDNTTTVQTDAARLVFSANTTVTGASVSLTQSFANPSGLVDHPDGANQSIGAFVDIIASPALRDNLAQVEIRVYYTDADIPAGTDESSLKLYLWDIETGTWQIVPGSGVNTAENYIFGTVSHLSTYGGFGTATQTQSGGNNVGGGGGGGGGGGSSSTVTSIGLKTTLGLRTISTYDGFVYDDAEADSYDNLASLKLPYGTVIRSSSGGLVTFLIIYNLYKPDEPQPGAVLIGDEYEFDPAGTTFTPAIPLTITYYKRDFPKGITEDMLCIAQWDENTGTYIPLNSKIDTRKNQITAYLSHFSRYAIIAQLPSAKFTVSDLTVTPEDATSGSNVDVSATVKNTGDASGNYTCNLTINGAVFESQTVTVNAAEQATVHFSIPAGKVGTYNISIGELTGSFDVIMAPASFKVNTLNISPNNADIGQKVEISVKAANTGQASGAYEVKLNINGALQDTKRMDLDGGAEQELTFSYIPDQSGTKTIDVNGLTGELTVKEPVPVSTTSQPVISTTALTKPVETKLQEIDNKTKTNVGAIAGIIVGICVLAGVILYFIFRRKGTKTSA